MKHILLYCYHCLLYSSGHDEWTISDICNVDITQPIDKDAIKKVSDFISIMEFLKNDVLQKYLELIRMSLLPQSGIAHILSLSLLFLCCCCSFCCCYCIVVVVVVIGVVVVVVISILLLLSLFYPQIMMLLLLVYIHYYN